MPTIAVTGVAGALGSRCLIALGQPERYGRIIGIDQSPPLTTAPGLHYEHGDLLTMDLSSVLASVDVVLHLAGSETETLSKVLAACHEVGVKQVITVSSAAAFGAWPTNPVPLADDAPLRPNPDFAYAMGLAERERMVSEWADSHPEVRVAVLRMAMIVGAKGGTSWLNALGGIGLHQRNGANRPVQFLHIDDAVSAMKFAVDNELTGVFNVAPTNFIGDAAAKAVAGVQPRPPLPRRMAEVVNRSLWRRSAHVSYDEIQPYLEYPWVMSSDRLRRAGWTSSYTSEEALVASEQPTWWGSLRPGQRRTVLGVAGTSGVAIGGVILALGLRLALRRQSQGPGTLRRDE